MKEKTDQWTPSPRTPSPRSGETGVSDLMGMGIVLGVIIFGVIEGIELITDL